MLPLRQEAPRLRPWRRPSSLASSGFRLLEVEPVADMPRVDRPRCGAVVTMVPWAEPGSRFTRDSESECTWLMSVANRKTVSGFLHVAWRTAGDIVRRVADRLRAAMSSPFDGLAAIGVDTARATRIRPWSDARTPRASSTVHGGSRNRCACSGSPLDRAGGELNRWVFRASHSRIPEIVELSKKNQETPPRHPTHHRTGLLQRQARGVRQQDQGHHPHGLRLPPRHQPHRPDHAPMQRIRHPTTTTHNLTHKNSRSLKDRYSCRAFWVIPRAWVDWHAVGEILAERCMPAHGNGWPAGKEYDANGSGVA